MSRLLLSPYSVRKRSTLGWMVIAFVTLICFTCLHPPLFDLGITRMSREYVLRRCRCARLSLFLQQLPVDSDFEPPQSSLSGYKTTHCIPSRRKSG